MPPEISILHRPIVITRAWRSELGRVAFFVVTAVAAPFLSFYFPGSIIAGKMFSIGGTSYWLDLPLFWLVPACALFLAVLKIYNARYIIDEDGVESRDGILSLKQTIVRFRHEDIRSVETDQTILDRMLDTGTLYISTAATGDAESTMSGIRSPKKVQSLLQGIREARLKIKSQEFAENSAQESQVN